MGQTITSLLVQPQQWTIAVTLTVADSLAGRSPTVVASGNYTRMYLATAGGAGTEESPKELLALVQTALNAAHAGPTPWSVTLRPNGRVRITWGGVGAASITWVGTDLRNALGFDANVVLAAPGSVDGDYQPSHSWFMVSRTEDSGWSSRSPTKSSAVLASGKVVSWKDQYQLFRRSFAVKVIPYNEATRAAYAVDHTSMWPPDASFTRWQQPSDVIVGVPLGWTVHETLSTCDGRRCAFALGDLQEHLAGSSTLYEVGYALPDMLQAEQRSAPSTKDFRGWVDVARVGLTLAGRESR